MVPTRSFGGTAGLLCGSCHSIFAVYVAQDCEIKINNFVHVASFVLIVLHKLDRCGFVPGTVHLLFPIVFISQQLS